MYGSRFGQQLPPAVKKEFDAFLAAFRAWLAVEHAEDGTHVPVAREVQWLMGPWILGGPEQFRDPAFVRLPASLPTGTYDDFAPAGFDTAIACSISATGSGGSGTDVILTGLRAPNPAIRRLLLWRNEDNTADMILMHEDTGSLEGNRFRLPNNADLTLNPNESVWLLYDTKWQRWSVVGMV